MEKAVGYNMLIGFGQNTQVFIEIGIVLWYFLLRALCGDRLLCLPFMRFMSFMVKSL
jgi:hypothetical protein